MNKNIINNNQNNQHQSNVDREKNTERNKNRNQHQYHGITRNDGDRDKDRTGSNLDDINRPNHSHRINDHSENKINTKIINTNQNYKNNQSLLMLLQNKRISYNNLFKTCAMKTKPSISNKPNKNNKKKKEKQIKSLIISWAMKINKIGGD